MQVGDRSPGLVWVSRVPGFVSLLFFLLFSSFVLLCLLSFVLGHKLYKVCYINL